MILLGIILFFTILEAIHEGLHFRGMKTLAGVVEFVKLTGMLLLVILLYFDQTYDEYFVDRDYLWHFWRYFFVHLILGWLFIRYALFDIIHNLAGKLNWYHMGTVKIYDRVISWIFRNQYPEPSFWVPRVALLVVGITLILRI